jgi:hypothetical protein
MRVDQEVARTLAELELKLRELERELTSVGRRQDADPAQARAPEPARVYSPVPPHTASVPPHAYAGPPLGGPPRVPVPAPPPPPPPPPPPGRLVDEVVEPPERRYSMEPQQTAYGEIPATRDERQAIDLGELVRFRETMQRTLQGLIDEYTRLLSLKPPSGD